VSAIQLDAIVLLTDEIDLFAHRVLLVVSTNAVGAR